MRAVAAALLLLATPVLAAERAVSLDGLHGTLEDAGKGAPAILILPGSGPTDRDGNAPPSLHGDTYKLLAQGLAAKGVTSLRVDKRGIGESRDAAPLETGLRFKTYADDARAWAAELRKETGTKCVWLLGHSEGALVAEVAAENPEGACGLILVAGAGRKAGDLIRDQIAANPANPPLVRQQVDAILNSLEAGKPVRDVPPYLAALFRPSVQPYMMSWLPLEPAALLSRITLPMLILQGENDIQVPLADAKLLAAAKPGAKLVLLPGVNHILKAAPTDRAANMATYADPSLPLAPGVVDAVANFVKAQP